MQKGNGSQTVDAIVSGHSSGDLQETLTAHEVGLEARAERIASPGDTRCVETGAAQQRIVQDGTKRCAIWQLAGNGSADNRKDLGQREAVLREESVSGAPILKLGAGSGEKTSHRVTPEAKQRTQREGLRAVGDAALVEGGDTFVPELLEPGRMPTAFFLKPKAVAADDAARAGLYLR